MREQRELDALLDNVVRVRGVMGAMLVSIDDGLMVAHSLMEGVRGNAVAALSASLYEKFSGVSTTSGRGEPEFIQLKAEQGVLIVVPARDRTLMVAIAESDVNVGLIRLEMRKAAERGA